MASANMTSHPLGANRRTAIAIAPRVVPTAMAAGRLRPARDFLGVSGAATEFSRRSVRSDLEQLAFFVLDELVDLPDILLGGLVEVLLRVFDVVLSGLAVLFDAVEFFHRLTPDVAHRHPGILALRLGLLDKIAAPLLGQLRDRYPDHVAVVGRVDAEVGVADRLLDRGQLRLLVRLDHDQPRLRHVDARQLRDRGHRAVVVDVDPGEHAWVRAAGTNSRQIVAGHANGLLHLLFGVEEGFVDHGVLPRWLPVFRSSHLRWPWRYCRRRAG